MLAIFNNRPASADTQEPVEPAEEASCIEREGITARRDASSIDFMFFACLPFVFLVFFVWGVVAVGPERMRDFHVFWEAGRHYLSGAAIYPSLTTAAHPPAHLAGNLFVYPAEMGALLVPFAVLPYSVACGVWLALGILAILGAIWLLGVRDWRCYGAAFLWPSTLTSLTVGTLTPFLVLAVAALWHWRDRVIRASLVGALAITSKLFLWPLLIWLATRRARAALGAVAVAVFLSAISWWPAGYGTLVHYPALLHAVSRTEGPLGYQVVWSLVPHSAVGLVLELFAVIAAALILWRTRNSNDRDGFCVAVAAALVLSPILWLHYFALLVPVAALRSLRLSWVWLVPVALWATPFQQSGGLTWRMALGLCVVVAMISPLPFAALQRLRAMRLAEAAD